VEKQTKKRRKDDEKGGRDKLQLSDGKYHMKRMITNRQMYIHNQNVDKIKV